MEKKPKKEDSKISQIVQTKFFLIEINNTNRVKKGLYPLAGVEPRSLKNRTHQKGTYLIINTFPERLSPPKRQ